MIWPDDYLIPTNIGEKHGIAKFIDKDIILIRESYIKGVTQVALAKKYGVYQGTISKIIRRATWSHLL